MISAPSRERGVTFFSRGLKQVRNRIEVGVLIAENKTSCTSVRFYASFLFNIPYFDTERTSQE